MIIRPYRASDFAACMLAFEGNYPKFFAAHERVEFEQLLHELADPNGAGNVYYYVVEMEDRIAACAGFYLQEDESAGAGLVWGMVAREFHRHGIGKTLLTFRLGKIQELRPGAFVELDTTQLSYSFFDKMGFIVTKITKDFYAPGLDRYDMVWRPA